MATEPTGQATTELAYIPDHEERAWRRLLSQDHTKPRLVAFAQALGAGVQEAEDVLFDLLVGRVLEDATGDVVDKWGAIVGEKRGGLDDADYRRFIKARVLVNIGDGTVDELVAIWRIITGPSQVVRYLPMYPAGYTLQVARYSFMSEVMRRRVRRTIEEARPAGVTSELIEALVGYYGFATDDYADGFDVGPYSRIL